MIRVYSVDIWVVDEQKKTKPQRTQVDYELKTYITKVIKKKKTQQKENNRW